MLLAMMCAPLSACELPQPPNALEIRGVRASGEPGAYTFEVEIASPDTGCDQYADSWEVIAAQGEKLYYRRVLTHSHVEEQPFTRSGGPVPIQADDVVFIRGHMSNGGYSASAYRGSPATGFEPVEIERDFAAGLLFLDPRPMGCAF